MNLFTPSDQYYSGAPSLTSPGRMFVLLDVVAVLSKPDAVVVADWHHEDIIAP